MYDLASGNSSRRVGPWLGVFHVAGGLIHLLLVVALVVFLFNFISGRRTV